MPNNGFDSLETCSRLDLAFAEFLCARVNSDVVNLNDLKTILAALSKQLNLGHSCLEIGTSDQQLVIASGLASSIPTEAASLLPLVIEDNRLYLQRYWHYETRLARQIKQLSSNEYPVNNLDSLVNRYFSEASEIDWQREAAKHALQHGICIITGGPGTGKTTTICKILALLQELPGEPLAIALAAPTGKAAMRLQEALSVNIAKLEGNQAAKTKIPTTATTIHRLLGAKPPSPYFRHNSDNPLMHDVVVVDEASMVDLALMSKLVDALKPNARLILLGDKDQLASVESGAVLADLISALPARTVELKHSYRFDSAIKTVAEAVNRQDAADAWELFAAGNRSIGLIQPAELIKHILNHYSEYKIMVDQGADFTEISRVFNRFQVLCANKQGNYGAQTLTRLVEHKLFQLGSRNLNTWYPGRPIMILQNDPALGLFNGDIGICLPEQRSHGNLMVFFQRPDGTVNQYPPSRLPACETVFAMTIHKSQGSEFDDVLIVLPDIVNPILTKALLYTAITRARLSVKLCAEKDIFISAVNNKEIRVSGLGYKLRSSE